jgi:hypothetical protein
MRAIAIVLSYSLGDQRFYKPDIIPIERCYSPRVSPLSRRRNMAISGHTTESAVIATMTVGTVLGVFAVAARLFTRIVIVRKAGWDDLIICAGCVSLLT